MTIAFLTLFFGLITGPYPVELTVSGPAASVEIVVDGRSAGTLPGAPWKGTINFGSSLLPHQVVARALDAQGHELGRAEEWVNLAHPPSKAEIVLEGGGKSPPKAAKVVWTNLKGEKPHAVSLTFDGLPVALDANGRGTLPAHDLGSSTCSPPRSTSPRWSRCARTWPSAASTAPRSRPSSPGCRCGRARGRSPRPPSSAAGSPRRASRSPWRRSR